VDARSRLKARSERYRVRQSSGAYVGFRKLTLDSVGAWYARYRSADAGVRAKTSLGGFEKLPPAQRYDAAKKAADRWFEHLGRGGTTAAIPVKVACANYVAHVRGRPKKGDRTANDLVARFARRIDDDPLGAVVLQKLTRRQIEAWRTTLAQTPVVVDRYARTPRTRARAASSVNRDSASLRAALNHARDRGDATTDMAWRVALRPIEGADGRRNVYLDRDQRRALIDHSPSDFAQFVVGLTRLPLRPGALARLKVCDFESRHGVLRVASDKAGQDRRILLPATTAAILTQLAKDRPPDAPLFARANGQAWDKDAWKKPMTAAAKAAALPAGTVTYTLRHSTITDLVIDGLDLLTVAQLSGTSGEMIERHYGPFRVDRAADALAKLAL
jgi:hypothetical protein